MGFLNVVFNSVRTVQLHLLALSLKPNPEALTSNVLEFGGFTLKLIFGGLDR